ncbi:Cytochrome P450 [Quillaja saponaria]|uniref:Cytochrome P450 n=1 Tax=Quillaja saponaria TaxID=32244 RepID=A0AAD7KZL6_QUISA|nr:Cytochrome P450 [Quillaja saponaria]
MVMEARSKPMNVSSDDIAPRILPFVLQIQKNGKNCFTWQGPTPNGEKWAKHRKIINPAFNLKNLKLMLPTIYQSCNDMISKWEALVSSKGSCELDVWPSLQNLTCDVIAWTAFGSSYEEGRRIFQLLKVQSELKMKVVSSVYIPGWRFLPIGLNKKLKENDMVLKALLKDIINRREKEMKAGEATNDDLLGILQHENNKNVGMSIAEVIEECKVYSKS